MPRYIAFLRAINLGKNRRFPMADLRRCMDAAGFTEVATHLATGNVRLLTPLRSRSRVESRLEEVFADEVGFTVPTIVYPPAELAEVYDRATALEVVAARRYLTFLKEDLPEAAAAKVDAWDAPGEGAAVVGRAVYWWIDHPSRAARLSNARVEGHGTVGTTRDLKVVATIRERWTR